MRLDIGKSPKKDGKECSLEERGYRRKEVKSGLVVRLGSYPSYSLKGRAKRLVEVGPL